MSPLVLQIAKSIVPAKVKFLSKARRRHGHWFLNTADRRLIERQIIPHFASLPGVDRVLDVGKDWYTAGYPALFPEQDYTSIDIEPAQAQHGDHRHQTASILELERHFETGSMDLVIANGVFGWGVNGEEDLGGAMEQIARTLRPGGFLVVGWNDVEDRRPEPIQAVINAPGFVPLEVEELGGDSVDTGTAHRHLYRFFQRERR